MPTPLTDTDTASNKWYHSIHELPMRLFKRVQLDNDLSALIIEGHPSDAELESAWDGLIGAYHEAKGDIVVLRRLVIYKELSLLTINLREVYECVLILRDPLRYAPFFHKKLNQMLECDLPLDPNDIVSYMKTLARYLKRSSSIKRAIELKKIEYEAVQQGAVGKKADAAYYDSMFITLSDYAKYRIDDSITVFEYCERCKRLNHYIKAQQAKR